MRRLPLLLAALMAAALVCAARPPSSPAESAADAAATSAYLRANYALELSANAHLHASEVAPLAVLHDVSHRCPHAGAGSPQNEASTQMSDEVIGAMVHAAIAPNLSAVRAFAAVASHLRWSSSPLTRAVHEYVADLHVLATLGAPDLCGDVARWAADGYRTLPPDAAAYVGRFFPAWVRPGFLPPQLHRFEQPSQAGMLRRSRELESNIQDGQARAVESWAAIMNELSLNP